MTSRASAARKPLTQQPAHPRGGFLKVASVCPTALWILPNTLLPSLCSIHFCPGRRSPPRPATAPVCHPRSADANSGLPLTQADSLGSTCGLFSFDGYAYKVPHGCKAAGVFVPRCCRQAGRPFLQGSCILPAGVKASSLGGGAAGSRSLLPGLSTVTKSSPWNRAL